MTNPKPHRAEEQPLSSSPLLPYDDSSYDLMQPAEGTLLRPADLWREPYGTAGPTNARRSVTAWYLLLAAAFPWYDGVSAAAAARGGTQDAVKLGVLALGVALAFAGRNHARLPAAHVLFGLLALVAALGALAGAETSIEGVLRSGRLIAVIIAVFWVGSSIGLTRVLRHTLFFVTALAASSLAAWATGLQPPVDDRLGGFLPPLHPNVLAAATVLGGLSAILLWASRRLGALATVVVVTLLLLTLQLTGSRTGAASLAAGFVVLAMWGVAIRHGRILRVLWISLLAVVGAMWVQANMNIAPLAANVVTRGGAAQIDSTLTGRIYAWAAASELHDSALQQAIGEGLQIKTVDRLLGIDSYTIQGIDSAWVSTYVSAGLIGVGILAAAVLALLVVAVKFRSVALLALLAAVVAASWTESFLADLSFPLTVLLGVAAAVAADCGSRQWQR